MYISYNLVVALASLVLVAGGCTTSQYTSHSPVTNDRDTREERELASADYRQEREQASAGYRHLSVYEIHDLPHMSILEKKRWGFIGHSTINHHYELKSIKGEDVVIDHATGLMWFPGTSKDKFRLVSRSRVQKSEYWFKKFRQTRYAGFNDWRMPTVEEAASLLEKSKNNAGLYIDPVFSGHNKIWTSDLDTTRERWRVNFKKGSVHTYVYELFYAYRPVRSITFPLAKEVEERKGFSSGTGFFVSNNGHILTNYHIVEDATTITIKDISGNSYDAKYLKGDSANDVALLKIESNTKPLNILLYSDVEKGSEVFTLGFPLANLQGLEQKATFGRVNALSGSEDDVRFLQIDVPLQPGNSGGPLFNHTGSVVGITTSTLNQINTLKQSGMLPQNVNYAVKIGYIVPILRGITTVQNERLMKKPFTDLIKENESSVVMVIAK